MSIATVQFDSRLTPWAWHIIHLGLDAPDVSPECNTSSQRTFKRLGVWGGGQDPESAYQSGKMGMGRQCSGGRAPGPGRLRRALEPPPAPSPHVCARLSLLWQLAPLRRQQAAESSPLLRGKMLSLKRPSGASVFYCNRRHRLPFVNLLVCARGERAGESGSPRRGPAAATAAAC